MPAPPKPRALIALIVFLIVESIIWLLFFAPVLADFTDNFIWVVACAAISLVHVEASWALIAKKRHARVTTLIATSLNWGLALASVLVALVLIIVNPSDLEHSQAFGYFSSIVAVASFIAIPTLVFSISYTNLLLRKPSQKWFEEINGPGRNMKKGFSIFLVVVLISTIVAGALIFTVSLLSDDGQGKDRRAKTTIRNAIVYVRATQNTLGDTDFASINQNILSENEPEINWVSSNLNDESDERTVALIELSASKIVMQTTNGKTCYFSELNADGPTRTRYGTSGMKDGTCPSTAGANGGNDFTDSSQFGWR